MKHVLPACGLMVAVISTTIIASTSFEDQKKDILVLVGTQIDILTEYRQCLDGASNTDMLRTCKREQKIAIKMMRKDSRERKKEQKERLIESLEKE